MRQYTVFAEQQRQAAGQPSSCTHPEKRSSQRYITGRTKGAKAAAVRHAQRERDGLMHPDQAFRCACFEKDAACSLCRFSLLLDLCISLKRVISSYGVYLNVNVLNIFGNIS
ncbi:hypothetical protein Q8A67_010141 [Cirrhinus molitorella]|uniref:Uncharacterized protein n=1 Tax=Cirrhinus molitorella TaxID=172907 RepID=A0AA88PT36_9TELE|nr:hypothetical protein Q8A67_010141 [Cirrhinus molitorella]